MDFIEPCFGIGHNLSLICQMTSEDIKHQLIIIIAQLRTDFRLVSGGASVQIRFGSPYSSKVVVCGHCLVTLSLAIYETIKWLPSLPILMHESFWWWQCSDRYRICLPSPPPPSPSLISLMVSVDVKHHVYYLERGGGGWMCGFNRVWSDKCTFALINAFFCVCLRLPALVCIVWW